MRYPKSRAIQYFQRGLKSFRGPLIDKSFVNTIRALFRARLKDSSALSIVDVNGFFEDLVFFCKFNYDHFKFKHKNEFLEAKLEKLSQARKDLVKDIRQARLNGGRVGDEEYFKGQQDTLNYETTTLSNSLRSLKEEFHMRLKKESNMNSSSNSSARRNLFGP